MNSNILTVKPLKSRRKVLCVVITTIFVVVLFTVSSRTERYSTTKSRTSEGLKARKTVHRMLEKAKSIGDISPYIDWNRLQDEYIIANVDSEIHSRRLNDSERRHRHNYNLNKVVGNAVGSASSVVGSTSNKKKKAKPSHGFDLDALLNGAMNDVEEVTPSKPVRKNQRKKPSYMNHLDSYITKGLAVEENEKKAEERQNDDTLGVDDDNRQENDEGIPIPVYSYSPCQDSGNIPCAPDNLKERCTKGETVDGQSSSFTDCFDACEESFCCIHDAPDSNLLAQNCNQDPNCAGYAYCYILWWKFHNTIGPATELRLEGNDDFFDIDANDIPTEVTGLEFFQELLFHHFDNYDEIIAAGTITDAEGNQSFNSDLIFLNPEYWYSDFTIGDIPMN